ncbi:MAG: amidase [Pseudomonadota bacterium]
MIFRLKKFVLILAGLAIAACETIGGETRETPTDPARTTTLTVATADETTILEANIEPDFADIITLDTLSNIALAILAGDVSSEDIVRAYLERIKTIDQSGPTLQSVLALNPDALEDARAADAALTAGETVGPLHGVPILLKDNIESTDPVATTAGAFALKDNVTERDASLTAGLREAGAIILGKTNLSQWANFRSSSSISGWSALGGQVRNPHMLDRTPCGSSSGSGAATAAALAAGSVGTETNGSVICPSSMNGIVGFKPTVGLVSQTGIVPISSTQDTAGPMTRSVRDAALMLNAMATDSEIDFTTALEAASFDGKRVGVLRFAAGPNAEVNALFDNALTDLENHGATLVEIEELDLPDGYGDAGYLILLAEFKHTLNEYLATTDPTKVTARSLAEVIAFNEENAAIEQVLFDQDILTESEATPGLEDAAYQAALEKSLKASREDGIDKWMGEHDLDVLVAPSYTAAFLVDAVHGDNFNGRTGAGYIAARAGYPHLTVPMGFVRGLPVGLSFMSTAGDDANVLALGYAYEQASAHIAPPTYLESAEDIATISSAMQPYKAE